MTSNTDTASIGIIPYMSRYKKHRLRGLRRRDIAVVESVAIHVPFRLAVT